MKHPLLASIVLVLTTGLASAQTTAPQRSVTTAAPAARQAVVPRAPHVLKINTASAQELMTLPGIGPKTSALLLRYRPFKNKAEVLKRVSRIGPAQWAKIERYVQF